MHSTSPLLGGYTVHNPAQGDRRKEEQRGAHHHSKLE